MLVVFAGLSGTGKTTLARLLAARRGAAHIRVDAIEAAMRRSGHTPESIGSTGYVVAQEIASSCLSVGTPVVIDAVSPVPGARQGWRKLAAASNEQLSVIELALTDRVEHRRRVENRRSDIDGLIVPTWEQVIDRDYDPWDERRDGPRLKLVNDTTAEAGLATILALIDS
jgi:predicted kinase